MPLQRRIPKFGFKNINRIEYQPVNLDTIQSLIDNKKVKTSLDFESMVKLRLVRKNELVKILGRGELKGKIKISAHKFTASAKSAIEAVPVKLPSNAPINDPVIVDPVIGPFTSKNAVSPFIIKLPDISALPV